MAFVESAERYRQLSRGVKENRYENEQETGRAERRSGGRRNLKNDAGSGTLKPPANGRDDPAARRKARS